jgi:hypothetical protein
MKQIKFTLLLLVTTLLVFGCKKEDIENKDCEHTSQEYIKQVLAPSQGSIGRTIEIKVIFDVKNGCGRFSQFIESKQGDTKTILVESQYSGCTCSEGLKEVTEVYSFNPTSSGKYYFKFKKSADKETLVIINVI